MYSVGVGGDVDQGFKTVVVSWPWSASEKLARSLS